MERLSNKMVAIMATMLVFIGVFILTSVIGTITYCLPAIVAPEIVGLERLIAIIK